MDDVRERESTPPPSKDRRWDTDERGEGVADAARLAPRIGELERLAREPRWISEEPDHHLWPHVERVISAPGSPWTTSGQSIDSDGTLVIDLVHTPVDGARARALRQAEVLKLLGFVIEGTTYIEIEERKDDKLVVDVVTGVRDDQTAFKTHGHSIRFRVTTKR